MHCVNDDVQTHAVHCMCIFRCDVIILYVYWCASYVYCIVSVIHNADALSCIQPLVSASLLFRDCTIGAGRETTDAHAALHRPRTTMCEHLCIPCSGSSMRSGSEQCTGLNHYIFECTDFNPTFTPTPVMLMVIVQTSLRFHSSCFSANLRESMAATAALQFISRCKCFLVVNRFFFLGS